VLLGAIIETLVVVAALLESKATVVEFSLAVVDKGIDGGGNVTFSL
jgi:hypothetical protein